MRKSLYKKMLLFKEQIGLTIIYFFAHWYLLVATGCWWDDWIVVYSTAEQLKERFCSSGRPWQAYNLMSVRWIPNGGYRIVVFVMFYLGSIFVYQILRSTKIFSNADCFWICALYIVVPINDARITLICYGYTLSLFLFWLSFYLITIWRNKKGKVRIGLRVLSLALLFYSYHPESLLVFTSLIWMYLFYDALREMDKESNLLHRCLYILIKNMDFLLLPFLNFAIRRSLFKPYGAYEGYNSFNAHSLFKGIINFPKSACRTFVNVINNYKQQFGGTFLILFFLLVVVVLGYLFKCKNVETEERKSGKTSWLMFAFGIVVYFIGVFPYIIVRGQDIGGVGVTGRDALLLGLGIAIMLYYGVRLIRWHPVFNKVVYIAIISLGILHFNIWYLNYQEDWYQQLQFEYEIAANPQIKQNNTFLCKFAYASPCDATRFYTLNGISYKVFGDQSRFFMGSVNEMGMNENLQPYLLNGYGMDNYDTNDISIDGVLLINNEPICNREVLSLRWDEGFHKDIFKDRICDKIDVEYITITEEKSKELYGAYKQGKLNSQNVNLFIGK